MLGKKFDLLGPPSDADRVFRVLVPVTRPFRFRVALMALMTSVLTVRMTMISLVCAVRMFVPMAAFTACE
jgi:hypothetical protein